MCQRSYPSWWMLPGETTRCLLYHRQTSRRWRRALPSSCSISVTASWVKYSLERSHLVIRTMCLMRMLCYNDTTCSYDDTLTIEYTGRWRNRRYIFTNKTSSMLSFNPDFGLIIAPSISTNVVVTIFETMIWPKQAANKRLITSKKKRKVNYFLQFVWILQPLGMEMTCWSFYQSSVELLRRSAGLQIQRVPQSHGSLTLALVLFFSSDRSPR
jgi:hypothetical protein